MARYINCRAFIGLSRCRTKTPRECPRC